MAPQAERSTSLYLTHCLWLPLAHKDTHTRTHTYTRCGWLTDLVLWLHVDLTQHSYKLLTLSPVLPHISLCTLRICIFFQTLKKLVRCAFLRYLMRYICPSKDAGHYLNHNTGCLLYFCMQAGSRGPACRQIVSLLCFASLSQLPHLVCQCPSLFIKWN